MLSTCRVAFLAGISACILAGGIITSQPAAAQFTDVYTPETILLGDAANLFASWGAGPAVDGFDVRVPFGWSVESAALTPNAYGPVALHVQELDGSRFQITADARIEMAADLVLTVRAAVSGDHTGSERVVLTPFIWHDPDGHADGSGMTGVRSDEGIELDAHREFINGIDPHRRPHAAEGRINGADEHRDTNEADARRDTDEAEAHRDTTHAAVTLRDATREADARRTMLHGDRFSFSLQTESVPVDPQNRVLSFISRESQPLLLRMDDLPRLDPAHAFSVSFWIKTTGLNEVVFSTWDGARYRSYPLEIVIDPKGRLRAFRGQPGEHQSIRSATPVADGSWHRVDVTNEPDTGWMRLKVDERAVDSIYSAKPLPFEMELAPAIGGRAPGEDPYFDGMMPYSGFLDELLVEPLTSRESATVGRSIRLSFDDEIPAGLLREAPRGVVVTRSNLTYLRPIRGFRAHAEHGEIVLKWRAQDALTREFVVERSRDGSSFKTVKRVVANDHDNVYEVREPAGGEGVAYFRLRQIFGGSRERVSGTIKVGMGLEHPEHVTLVGNFPNPFNATTTISYSLTEPSDVDLSVWDLSGQPVRQLINQTQGPGFHEMEFDAGDMPSGTYFIRLETPSGTKSHQMILMK